MKKTTCIVGHDCTPPTAINQKIRRGFCPKHYERWKRRGNAFWEPLTIEERFHTGFNAGGPNDCWLWEKKRNAGGYGQFSKNHKEEVGAHRFMWELVNGMIPEGMYVCHRCDNPPCINPAHLFLGTPKDNMQDKKKKGRWKGNQNRDDKGKFTFSH